MRKEEIASWDGGRSTWGGRDRGFGTVSVVLGAQKIAWGRGFQLIAEMVLVSVIQRMEKELYNLKMKGMDIDGYTNQFHELALLYLRMVEPEAVKLARQLIQDKADEATEIEKRKGKGDRGSRSDNRHKHNRC
nr:hypothetical protein [Tanacetum cinerariifolium]